MIIEAGELSRESVMGWTKHPVAVEAHKRAFVKAWKFVNRAMSHSGAVDRAEVLLEWEALATYCKMKHALAGTTVGASLDEIDMKKAVEVLSKHGSVRITVM